MAHTGVTHTLVTETGSRAAPNVLSQNPCFNKTSGDSCILSSLRSSVYPIKTYPEEGKGWGVSVGKTAQRNTRTKTVSKAIVCHARDRGRLPGRRDNAVP